MNTYHFKTDELSELLSDTKLTLNIVPFNVHTDNHSGVDLSDETLKLKTVKDMKLTKREYEEISQTTRESWDDINPDGFRKVASHLVKRLIMSACDENKRYKITEPIVRLAYDYTLNFEMVAQVTFRILEL